MPTSWHPRWSDKYKFFSGLLAIVMLVPRLNSEWVMAVHRFFEVSIGIAVGLAFTAIWPERKIARSAALDSQTPSDLLVADSGEQAARVRGLRFFCLPHRAAAERTLDGAEAHSVLGLLQVAAVTAVQQVSFTHGPVVLHCHPRFCPLRNRLLRPRERRDSIYPVLCAGPVRVRKPASSSAGTLARGGYALPDFPPIRSTLALALEFLRASTHLPATLGTDPVSDCGYVLSADISQSRLD